jgi:MFS family permease
VSAFSPPLPCPVADRARGRAQWRVVGATALIVLGFSTVQPLLAVLLQKRGVPAGAIGLFATLPFLTVALMLPLLPAVFARLGVARAYRGGLMLQIAAVLGYVLHDSYGWWCVCSVIGSIGIAAEWNGTEAMVAFNAPPATRGRVTGLYQTLLGAALALGPLLPALVHALWPAASPRALLLVSPLIFVAALPLATVAVLDRLPVARAEARGATLWAALRRRPELVWIAFAGGVFETGLSSISAAHGAQQGLSLAAATSIAGALGLGSFMLQYPAGWLADRWPIGHVVAGAGVLLLASTIAFTSSGTWPELLWFSAFLWGAVGGALYTLAMVRVSHDFAASSAIAGAAAMISGYTVGGAIGPLVSGLALEQAGVAGLAGWLALLASSVLLAARRG